jgi:ribosomal protein S18 acetylase RimI-like enzyme
MTVSSQPLIGLRAATVEDAAQVATLGAHVFSVTFGHSVTPEQLQDYLQESYSTEATVKDILDTSKNMVLATTQRSDGAAVIVGFALLTRGSSEPCIAHLGSAAVELQRIYVHPDCHGQGVGKMLANELEDMARKQGFGYMWLGVWEDNHQAQKVYERLGYKAVGDHDFVIGGDVQTDHIMLKEL